MLEFMKLFTQICAALILGFQLTSPALAVLDDWMTWASTYTHDSQGVRVDQYAMPVQPLGPDRDSYQRSGYRHFRSTLQAGQSADNYHVVEQFGAPVIPYEQWRFPFRPYGVPYDAWGPQTPLSMTSINAGGFFPGAYGFPPGRPGLPPVALELALVREPALAQEQEWARALDQRLCGLATAILATAIQVTATQAITIRVTFLGKASRQVRRLPWFPLTTTVSKSALVRWDLSRRSTFGPAIRSTVFLGASSLTQEC